MGRPARAGDQLSAWTLLRRSTEDHYAAYVAAIDEQPDDSLDAIGWPRRDVVGFGPAKPTLAYTAVLTRPASP